MIINTFLNVLLEHVLLVLCVSLCVQVSVIHYVFITLKILNLIFNNFYMVNIIFFLDAYLIYRLTTYIPGNLWDICLLRSFPRLHRDALCCRNIYTFTSLDVGFLVKKNFCTTAEENKLVRTVSGKGD